MAENKTSPAPVPLAPVPKTGPLILNPFPGVRRDGTFTDSDFYTEAQWCRFVRNRPRKIGGFQEITPSFSGPLRGGFLWSHQFLNLFCGFSEHGVEYSYVDQSGIGSIATAITPTAYVRDPNTLWAYDYLYDDASGANATLLIASPTKTLVNIDDPTEMDVYVTPLNSPGTMTKIADSEAKCSGGIFCTNPYVVLLKKDGSLVWSDANSPQTYSSGDAGADRVTGTKLVKGLPLRTGISSGGLLWSLDSVIRMDWIGGSSIFKFSHISKDSSILSQNSVIEYGGKWYWIGLDRFMVTNGVQVEELTNDMNLQWFLDHLNFAHRQKVSALKIPRYGEIWWLFPKDDSTECNHAIIYNLRTKIWYDTEIHRSFGMSPATYRYPIMASSDPNIRSRVTVTIDGGDTFSVGDTIIGKDNGSMAVINDITGSGPHTFYVTQLNTLEFQIGEKVQVVGTSNEATISSIRDQYTIFSHEKGYDAVEEQGAKAIHSYFVTNEIGAPTGGAQPNATSGVEMSTRITRIEPDFTLSGTMEVQVLSSTFAQSDQVQGNVYTFGNNTGKIDMRDQAREFRLKFSSNELGGSYEAGKTLVHLEPGDQRP